MRALSKEMKKMERSAVNTDKGSKADFSKDSASRIRPVGENKGKELDPLRGLVQGAECRGCGSSLESVAQRMASLPGAQRREAALSLQRSRGNRFVKGMAVQVPVQAKMSTGAIAGLHEREAERSVGMQQPAVMQRQADPELEEDEEVLQGKFESNMPAAKPMQPKPEPNRTGMPDGLKAGIESLSGIDMSDVRVHANSDKPARLNALAYTQGNQIYLGPGEERHLPHEARHAVQQKQRWVRATRQMEGFDINDDSSLEYEADLMEAKAAQFASEPKEKLLQGKFGEGVAQKDEKSPNNTGLPVNMKTGIENLSGIGMNGAQGQCNSLKPAQLNALAHAHRMDIHVEQRQEKHLAHEAWHVVQQVHGKVPAIQKQGLGVAQRFVSYEELNRVLNNPLQGGEVMLRPGISAKILDFGGSKVAVKPNDEETVLSLFRPEMGMDANKYKEYAMRSCTREVNDAKQFQLAGVTCAPEQICEDKVTADKENINIAAVKSRYLSSEQGYEEFSVEGPINGKLIQKLNWIEMLEAMVKMNEKFMGSEDPRYLYKGAVDIQGFSNKETGEVVLIDISTPHEDMDENFTRDYLVSETKNMKAAIKKLRENLLHPV